MTRKVFDPDHLRGMVQGFHSAVRHDNLVFLAGQVALDENMQVVPGGLAEQTRKTLENVSDVLALAGCTPQDLVQFMIFYKQVDGLIVADAVADLALMKEEILPGSGPVGFACTVQGLLLPDLLIEVQVVAVAPTADTKGVPS